MGISQLKKLDYFLKSRSRIHKFYNKNLKKISQILTPNHKPKYVSSNHLYLINLKKGDLSIKEKLIKFMLKKNIVLQYHYIPIYKFKNFHGNYLNQNTEKYYKSTLSLPIYHGLRDYEQKYIIKNLNLFFNEYYP